MAYSSALSAGTSLKTPFCNLSQPVCQRPQEAWLLFAAIASKKINRHTHRSTWWNGSKRKNRTCIL